MARSGTFGKLPKAAPDLSATIAALLAEYMAQVDQNMVDAWRNGGEVDGKAVTDGRLLKHFKDRRNELDPKDPEYQQWDNRITQYEFAIEESKMAVKWDNGQASERDMMAFYRKWEKKTPDNTEFDRSLRKSFGQWQKSASSRAAASNAEAKIKAHNAWAKDQYDKHVKPADTANAWLSGLLYNWGPLSDAGSVSGGKVYPPSNIAGLEAGSGDDFETLIALYENGDFPPDRQADIDAFVRGMKKIDPSFEFSMDWFNKANDSAQTAIDRLEKRSLTDTERNQWAAKGADIQTTTNRINAAPAVEDAKAARVLWEKEMVASHGNPALQKAATEKYLATMEKTVASIDKAGSFKDATKYDTGVVPGMNNEIAMLRTALSGGKIEGKVEPTWLDSTGLGTSQGGADADSWGPVLNAMNDNQNKIANGGWAVVTTDPNTNEKSFVYFDADQPPPVGLTVVGGYDGAGQGITVYVEPEPVSFVAIGPDGLPTGNTPVKTDAKGNMLKPDGTITTDPKEADTGPDQAFLRVELPNPVGEPIEYYQINLPNGQTVRTLDPSLAPGFGGEERTIDGQRVLTINQTPEQAAAGSRFRVSDYLQFGPQTPNSDAGRPTSPFTSDPNDPTKITGTQPGFYTTDEGIKWAGMLDALDIKDPNYLVRRNDIMNSAQMAAEQLAQNAFRAGERGDTKTAEALGVQAQNMTYDFRNLMVLAVAQSNGDKSSLGQSKAADTIKFSQATWNGSNVVTGVTYGEGATLDDKNMADARSWALEQVKNYDMRYQNTIGPAFDKSKYEQSVLPTAGGLGGWMGAPSSLLPTAAGYSSIQEQIEKAKDPRLLKLPTGVTDGTNPFLPTTTPPVVVPTTPGVGAPGPNGPSAGPTAVAPPPPAKPPAPAPAPVPKPPGTNLTPTPVPTATSSSLPRPPTYSRFGVTPI